MASAWDQSGIIISGGGGGASTSGLVAPNDAEGWVLAEAGGTPEYLVAVSTTDQKALLAKQVFRYNTPLMITTANPTYGLVLGTPGANESLLDTNVVRFDVDPTGCTVSLPAGAVGMTGARILVFVGGGPITFDDLNTTTITPFGSGVTAAEFFGAEGLGWILCNNVAQTEASATDLAGMISGTATVGAASASIAVTVGAAYNGKPAIATKATPDATFVVDTAIVTGGDLVITSLAGATVGCDINWFIDGR